MKALSVCLSGIALAAAVWLALRTHDQDRQISDLTAQVAKAAGVSNLDLQERCAKQASAEFAALGYKKSGLASVESHYNAKLQVCFAKVEDDTSPSVAVNVFDAVEGTGYGEYFWANLTQKKYWDVPPKVCDVKPPNAEKKLCHSREEFDSLMKPYLER